MKKTKHNKSLQTFSNSNIIGYDKNLQLLLKKEKEFEKLKLEFIRKYGFREKRVKVFLPESTALSRKLTKAIPIKKPKYYQLKINKLFQKVNPKDKKCRMRELSLNKAKSKIKDFDYIMSKTKLPIRFEAKVFGKRKVTKVYYRKVKGRMKKFYKSYYKLKTKTVSSKLGFYDIQYADLEYKMSKYKTLEGYKVYRRDIKVLNFDIIT